MDALHKSQRYYGTVGITSSYYRSSPYRGLLIEVLFLRHDTVRVRGGTVRGATRACRKFARCRRRVPPRMRCVALAGGLSNDTHDQFQGPDLRS